MTRNQGFGKIFFFNLIGIFLLLFLVNGFFIGLIQLEKWRKPQIKTTQMYDFPLHKDDPELGYYAHPNVSNTYIKTYGDKIVYQVEYATDKYGRRKHPSVNPMARKFAVFFGGSNTFGEGLPATETLPYLFEKKNPQFHSYNYAFFGWGPNNNLRQLQTSNIPNQVFEKDGLVIYQYFDFHRKRVLGTARHFYFSWQNTKSPYYRLIDGKLRHKGSFYKSHPFYVWFLKVIYPGFLEYFHIDFFEDNYSISLTCAVIMEMKKSVEQQFPKSDFVVLVGLNSSIEDPFIERCFVKKAIPFIDARLDDRRQWKTPCPDCRKMPKPVNIHGENKLKIMSGVEGHYSFFANEILSDRLSHWLLKKKD